MALRSLGGWCPLEPCARVDRAQEIRDPGHPHVLVRLLTLCHGRELHDPGRRQVLAGVPSGQHGKRTHEKILYVPRLMP